jgi:hypothetical protein
LFPVFTVPIGIIEAISNALRLAAVKDFSKSYTHSTISFMLDVLIQKIG